MDYDTLIQRLFTGEMEGVILEGVSYSYPIIGMLQGRKCDKFFLYTKDRKSGRCSEPFARIALAYEDGKILTIQEREISKNMYDMKIPSVSTEKRKKILEAFQRDYMLIRKVAYQPICTSEDIHILKRMLEEYYLLVGEKGPYEETAPEFFEWMKKQTGREI